MGFPRFSNDPVILARQIDHFSRLAMVPARDSDHENVDRWFDARAEAIHPDPNYPPLEEDLQPTVPAGSLSASTNLGGAGEPPPARPAEEPNDVDAPRTVHARRA